ncbi:MAG: sulfotransferase family protein [Leptolyngbyaceae cyanobacterium SL_7_1]|nr:sulfotransferase family protein [Leptolyngbyaceae cyanobacterium SL_7_1]
MVMESGSIEYQLTDHDQLCFIHIPKTAGTTFTAILDAKFNQAEICPAAVWSELTQLSPEELAHYKLLRGHFYYYVYKFLPQKPVYITMLRDPIERVISGYEFMRRHRPSRPEGLPTHEKALTMSLKEYVCDPSVPGITNAQTRHLSMNLYKELSDDLNHPKWLESAKENLEEFAFVGVTERFDNAMALLAYVFGWNPLLEYQNLMVAPKRLRQESLSADVIEAIAERNQLDIALYQFAKEKFNVQYDQMLQNLSEQFNYPASDQLEPQQIYTLLEKHYEYRHAILERSPVPQFLFDFNQALLGRGWHLREGLERNHVFRWTGPGTLSTLDLPQLEPQDTTIQFRIINTVASDILESLELQVNGCKISFFPLHSDVITTVFQGEIPASCLVSELPFTRLTFKVDRTTSLHSVDPTNLDTRPVGLAFDLIQLYPVNSPETTSAVSFLFDNPAWQERSLSSNSI